MIFLKRRRLLVWLVKAYFKKWRKILFISFIGGTAIFILLYFASGFLSFLPFKQKVSIGMVGSYSIETLPLEVLGKVSGGLTKVERDGEVSPSIASSWSIRDNGKTYVFNLRRDVYFADNTRLTSYLINYNFIDVAVERPDEDTIIFKLKDSYSPFLITVSKPIFKKNFIGVGSYKVNSIDLNGNFVESIELISRRNQRDVLSYNFYPSDNALKIAFVLGEVSKIQGLTDTSFLDTKLNLFSNFKIQKNINYSQLISLFFNTQDSLISDENLRKALIYAIPNEFANGSRSYTPFPPRLWAYVDPPQSYSFDLEYAKLLLKQTETSTKSAAINLTIKTLSKHKNTAETIKKEWGKIGIKTKIEEVKSLPENFQIFLGEFNVPKDPDQYVLWHSSQHNNISNYRNLRIDKLLEDGRQTIGNDNRKSIYADFQKYLLDDPPAAFLYFPYSYTVSRK